MAKRQKEEEQKHSCDKEQMVPELNQGLQKM